MRQAKDYTGQKFGAWTILARGNRPKMWLAECQCGNICHVNIDNLKAGRSKNCQKCRGEKSRQRQETHGLSKTRLYYVWLSMRNRCYRPQTNGYERYGGRGITVCKEWREHFEPFAEWAITNGYRQGLQIDRVDNNGNYEPQNCRWVTHRENLNNTSRTFHLQYKGRSYTAQEAAEAFNISAALLRERIHRGWSVEEAITTPVAIGNNQTLRSDKNGIKRQDESIQHIGNPA